MTVLTPVLAAAAAIGWLALIARVELVAARMFQIEEYESKRFLRWGMRLEWLAHRAVITGALVAAVTLVVVAAVPSSRPAAVAGGWLVAAVVAHVMWTSAPAKKALVLTARMRRLLATVAAIAVAIATVIAVCVVLGLWLPGGLLAVAVTLVTPLALGLSVLANIVMKPAEAAVRRHYLTLARAKLHEVDPLVVAVVGSYGKTSTKHILAQLLQPSIATLATRKSFNTLMGVSRVINEDLQPTHRLFIVEMDAYAQGEIASICNLVHPRIALLTSVGPQHLERFGAVDRIADALYEVVASLPRDGTAVIHTGDAGAALAQRARVERRKVVRYRIAGGDSADADVVASGVHLDSTGARFRWSWPAAQLQREVAIPLLGMHQVLNVSAALAAVHLLGHDLDAAVSAAASLQTVEHRLQILQTSPVTVIDDSYNANPVGVHNALDVLGGIEGGAKILVTPGIVELGSVEDEENRRYGRHAAAVCDHVIVVAAPPAKALCVGLRDGGMAEDRIHVVASLEAASALIGRLARPGDVVLFANDLPDTYSPPRHLAKAGF